MSAESDPQPISLADAKRLWTLQQQNAPLSKEDEKLLEQAAIWQMWTSHGIRLNDGSNTSGSNTELSLNSAKVLVFA